MLIVELGLIGECSGRSATTYGTFDIQYDACNKAAQSNHFERSSNGETSVELRKEVTISKPCGSIVCRNPRPPEKAEKIVAIMIRRDRERRRRSIDMLVFELSVHSTNWARFLFSDPMSPASSSPDQNRTNNPLYIHHKPAAVRPVESPWRRAAFACIPTI